MTSQNETLSGLTVAAEAVAADAQAVFGGLTPSQLNWQPGPGRWSVGQCFDHLLTSNEAYFPVFEKVLGGEHESTVWQRLPWLPSFWGKMLLKAVSPETPRKLKAPKILQPTSSRIDGAIVRRFVEQQGQLIGYMKALGGLDLERIRISSPITDLIAYSLMDALRVIVAHEQRHFLQARRVAETDGFPADAS